MSLYIDAENDFQMCGNVIARGIARLYYERGLPLAASASYVKTQGLKISWLNVARQMKQQGFSTPKIVGEFRELISFHSTEADIDEIINFCELDDESQKERLWEFWQQHTSAEELLGVGQADK